MPNDFEVQQGVLLWMPSPLLYHTMCFTISIVVLLGVKYMWFPIHECYMPL